MYKNACFWKMLSQNYLGNNDKIPKPSLGLGIIENILGKDGWFKLQLNKEFIIFMKKSLVDIYGINSCFV